MYQINKKYEEIPECHVPDNLQWHMLRKENHIAEVYYADYPAERDGAAPGSLYKMIRDLSDPSAKYYRRVGPRAILASDTGEVSRND